MALVQIRVKCRKRFRECANRCFGCREATVVEVKNLSGRPVTNDPGGLERVPGNNRVGANYGRQNKVQDLRNRD